MMTREAHFFFPENCLLWNPQAVKKTLWQTVNHQRYSKRGVPEDTAAIQCISGEGGPRSGRVWA